MANLYLNKKRDADLYGLFQDVGAERFRKIAKACLRALFDEKQAKLARFLASEGVREDSLSLEDKESGVLFRVSTTAEKDEYLRTIISSLAPGTVSTFIKTTMRQVLGPQILLKYFLLPGSSVHIEDIQPTAFVRMAVDNESDDKSVKKKRKSPSKRKMSCRKVSQSTGSCKVSLEVSHKDDIPVSLTTEQPAINQNIPVQSENFNNNYEQFDQSEANTGDDSEMDILSMLEAMMQ